MKSCTECALYLILCDMLFGHPVDRSSRFSDEVIEIAVAIRVRARLSAGASERGACLQCEMIPFSFIGLV